MSNEEKTTISSEKLKALLDNVEWATLNVAIAEKYNCLLIPEEKWQSVSDALYNEVGANGWRDEWDY